MRQSKEEKRETLLKAAYMVLLEHGPRKTTLDDIALRAGMAKTSLYYYFKDKDEIILAIIKNDMEHLLDMMTSAVQAAGTSEEKMCALVEARYRFISTAASRATREIIDEFRSMMGVYAAEKEHYQKLQKEMIEMILLEGIKKGELKPIEDVELVGLIMISSMWGIDWTFALYDQREYVLDGIKKMVKIFFAGLRVAS